jgi:hypothetical protein
MPNNDLVGGGDYIILRSKQLYLIHKFTFHGLDRIQTNFLQMDIYAHLKLYSHWKYETWSSVKTLN